MPHLAPINWLIIWCLIWGSFFLFSVVVWWKFKPYYNVFSMPTLKTKKCVFWIW